jgi:ABC-type spermidine/putrescine transport system permease subunit II
VDTLRSPTSAVIAIAALVFLYVPLAIVVLFSFNSTGGLSFPIEGLSLRWYRETFGSPEFRSALENSAIVAVATSAITLVVGTMAAYGMSRTRGRLRAPVAILLFVPVTLPGLFIGIALLSYFSRLQFDLSLRTVIVAHLVYVLPYYLLIAMAAFDRLDPALEESAADLGATPWQAFWRVTMPQVWPVLAGAVCLAFALSFDEFIITFFVIGPESTLPMYIWSGLRRTVDPSINVVSTVLMAVTIALWVVAFLFTLRAGRRTVDGSLDVLTGSRAPELAP